MFVSTRRNIVFPQSEHAKLAGDLACVWGNRQFQAPGTGVDDGITFTSFCRGVALHDTGHGIADTNKIGGMSAAAQRDLSVRMFEVQLDDPIAEIVVKFHVLRLMRGGEDSDLYAAYEKQIRDLVWQCGLHFETFQRLDSITNLCDSIAFDFCFEKPAENTIEVTTDITSEKALPIQYEFDGKETIKVSPWPFSIDRVTGYILAYKAPEYPDDLNPVYVPYHVIRGDGSPR